MRRYGQLIGTAPWARAGRVGRIQAWRPPYRSDISRGVSTSLPSLAKKADSTAKSKKRSRTFDIRDFPTTTKRESTIIPAGIESPPITPGDGTQLVPEHEDVASDSDPEADTSVDSSLTAASGRSRRRSASSKEEIDPNTSFASEGMTLDETRQYNVAVLEGKLPNTQLSRVIFKNWIRFPDTTILTRVGGFYESYFEPCYELSEVLGLRLASRVHKSKGRNTLFHFCGFPINKLDKYLKILVHDLGRTVVVVEETDERTDKDLKERRVGRVVTPGTLIDESWLNGGENRYLLAIAVGDASSDTPAETSSQKADEDNISALPMSMVYTDPSTGEFFSKESTIAQLEDELTRIAPREIVLDRSLKDLWEIGVGDPTGTDKGSAIELLALIRILGFHVSFADTINSAPLENKAGIIEERVPKSPKQLSAISLESQAIALLRYHMQYAFRRFNPFLGRPRRQAESAYMHIDAATLQALEIRHAFRPSSTDSSRGSPLSTKGTLLSVLDETVTNAGHRLLVRTLTAPSTVKSEIESRHQLVQAFVDREDLRVELRETMRTSRDVIRSVHRLRGLSGDPEDIWIIASWIRMAESVMSRIKSEIKHERSQAKTGKALSDEQEEALERLQDFVDSWRQIGDTAMFIETAVDTSWVGRGSRQVGDEGGEDLDSEITPEALTTRSTARTFEERESSERARVEREEYGFWLKPTANFALRRAHAQLRLLKRKTRLLLERLRDQFDEQILLTKYGRYGYWVTHPRKAVVNRMKKEKGFTSAGTSETGVWNKEWTAIGGQRDETLEKIEFLQNKEFKSMRTTISKQAEVIQANAELIDELDLTMGFAHTAAESAFVRPTMTDGTEMSIINGRHPTVEASLNSSIRPFTPNSTVMSPGTHLQIITGPNQGGKSTLLRQTAVIAILAQAGSFVPADRATIGIVDKVFSRIGARDDLFRDRSTFMLEMVETAAILRYATNRSLVIMDEIGRGTTLQAGMSIAYATLDYILSQIKCRTLFATHYHELGAMLCGQDYTPPVGHTGILRPQDMPQRQGVEFWCTDVNEVEGAFSYSYKLEPGINFNSHAIKAARIAGMPNGFLCTASETLDRLKVRDAKIQGLLSQSESHQKALPGVDSDTPTTGLDDTETSYNHNSSPPDKAKVNNASRGSGPATPIALNP